MWLWSNSQIPFGHWTFLIMQCFEAYGAALWAGEDALGFLKSSELLFGDFINYTNLSIRSCIGNFKVSRSLTYGETCSDLEY